MLTPREIASSAGRYLKSHPEELIRVIRSSFGLRFGVPLAVFRWVIEQLIGHEQGFDPSFEAVPPGLRLGLTLDRMDTKMRLSTVLYLRDIRVSADELRVELRFEDTHIKVLSRERSIPAALIKSGALDLTNIGAIVRELPNMPPYLVHADQNRITVDLMAAPQLRDNRLLRHAVGLISSLITVDEFRTDEAHMDLSFKALPLGVKAAQDSLKQHLIRPGRRSIRRMLGWDRPLLSAGRGYSES